MTIFMLKNVIAPMLQIPWKIEISKTDVERNRMSEELKKLKL